jgi:alpha-glucosidase (family GH31 glycosyl hydrolase)
MRERSFGVTLKVWGFAAAAALAAGGSHPIRAAGTITGLSVKDTANAADWSVQSSLQAGNTQYGDRAFTFTSVPASVQGAEWIRTANDSKAFTASPLATFTVATDADVFVALNDRVTTPPAWLAAGGWSDTGDNLVNSEATPRTFSLFKKSFAAGALVSLGPNGSTTASTYTVIVKGATGSTGDAVLESPLLRVALSLDPYHYTVVEKSTGQVLVSHSSTSLTLSGTARTVASARSVTNDGTTLGATLVLGGTSTTGHVRFTFTQPDVVQVQIDSDGAAPSNVTEEFGDQGEHYYGLWEYHLGNSLDNRGQEADLLGFGHRADTNFASSRAPFYVTSRKYGIYTESVAQGHYAVAVGGKTHASFDDASLRYHVLYGPTYQNIFQRYNDIAGGSFMPPLWAFDSIWWRDDNHQDRSTSGAANSQDLAIKDADNLQAHRIHAASMWLDRPYGTGTQGWGNMDFDSSFPSPSKMVSDLQARGINLMVWITNRAANDLLTDGEARGFLFSTSSFTSWPAADLRKPGASDWFKGKLDAFVSLGIKGYKIDRGEEGEQPDSVQNENVMLFAKLSKEGQEARHPGDSLVFARNVFDTARKYEAIWNGDTKISFAALAGSIKDALRAGAMNFPMWGSDTGGYNGGTETKELFARWLEFSAYATMMEVKIGPNRTPWNNFDAELVTIAAEQAFAHHDLIPYTRSNVFVATQTGTPVMRQLLFDYPDDATLVDRGDEYLFGKFLLVAPVTTAGATSRSVYLPAGSWIDYNDKKTVHTGPATIAATAPLDTIPLFAKAGAVIPRGDILKANNNWTPNWAPSLHIELFPAPVGASSFDYFTGKAVQTITSTTTGSTISIQFGDLGTNGALEVHCDGVTSVTRNGAALTAGTDFTFDAGKKLLTVAYSGATTLVIEGTGSLF